MQRVRTISAMPTTTTTATVTDPALGASALLQLMWLASPALPVGGYSYSEMLEAAVEAFEPDSGAYASGGHDHGHHDAHDHPGHDHGHAH